MYEFSATKVAGMQVAIDNLYAIFYNFSKRHIFITFVMRKVNNFHGNSFDSDFFNTQKLSTPSEDLIQRTYGDFFYQRIQPELLLLRYRL